MAKKKNNKPNYNNLIISLGFLISVLLGIIKIISGSGSWLKVFSPLIIAFIILFILNLIKSGVKKI